MSLSWRELFPVRQTHNMDENNARNVHVHGYEPEIKLTVLVVSRC